MSLVITYKDGSNPFFVLGVSNMSDIAKNLLQYELDNLQSAMNALNSGKEQISFVRWNERNQ